MSQANPLETFLRFISVSDEVICIWAFALDLVSSPVGSRQKQEVLPIASDEKPQWAY